MLWGFWEITSWNKDSFSVRNLDEREILEIGTKDRAKDTVLGVVMDGQKKCKRTGHPIHCELRHLFSFVFGFLIRAIDSLLACISSGCPFLPNTGDIKHCREALIDT